MLLPFVVLAIGVGVVLYITLTILDKSPGTERMEELSRIIQNGARTFLFQEYKVFFPIVLLLALLFWYTTGYKNALAIVVGSIIVIAVTTRKQNRY